MLGTEQALLLLCVFGNVWSLPVKERIVRDKRSDDAAPLQAVVDDLAQQLSSVKAQLAAQQTQITNQQSKLDNYGREVAFHAWCDTSPISVTAQGTVIVPHVATNIGNAYDPQTGFFTAPVSGLYMFHATFKNHDMNDYIHAGIHVGGSRVAMSISDSRHGYNDNPAIAAVVHVNVGQKVNLRSEDGEVDNFGSGQYTTFSGFLIRAD